MAYEYNPPRNQKYNFDPKSSSPYRMSRSGLESYIRCKRCFYMDKRLGLAQPPMPSFTLNNAVDTLLKKEFDVHRANGQPHPLLEEYGLKVKPVSHELLEQWRNTFEGIKFLHKPTNIEFYGGIDDLWQGENGEYIVVDYKATSKDGRITLDSQWQDSYKRQLEIYQWLLRHNGLEVSNKGYFVYCNGKKDLKAFDKKLEFEIELIEHVGDDSWVEPTLIEAHKCLLGDLPDSDPKCDYCKYRKYAQNIEIEKSEEKVLQKEEKVIPPKPKIAFEDGKLF